ncbi:hypothetical protein Bca52824_049570 [Brassica carinata]|uniref:Uncharacterized protein n=1 Tax=Brassica carinata TaxID=52824 RepID=A0A8X7UU96_BRACI|nr:hypothetical protein Bca52824_049570 [Brassica carinata]
MVDHCMVIPGEWTSAGELWEFVIDKKKMSRIVPIHPGVSLSELRDNVAKEFYTFTVPAPPSTLSYWPPNSKELATGLTTPPIIMTNDGAISYFLHHLAINPTMNLSWQVTCSKTAHETYQSTTGVFDHTVRLSGEDDTDWKRDLDFQVYTEGAAGQSNPTTRCGAKRSTPHSLLPWTFRNSDTPDANWHSVHSACGCTS